MIDEAALTKGQLRKHNAFRKSVGTDRFSRMSGSALGAM